MANVLHSQLTGSDLHEVKGAQSASAGQVPIANGSGGAPFGALSYTQVGNTPIPKLQLNNTDSVGQAKMKVYTTTSTAVTGAFSIAITGFTAIWGVFPNTTYPATGSGELGALVAIKTVTTSAVTGNVYSYTSNTNTGVAAPLQILVIGV